MIDRKLVPAISALSTRVCKFRIGFSFDAEQEVLFRLLQQQGVVLQ